MRRNSKRIADVSSAETERLPRPPLSTLITAFQQRRDRCRYHRLPIRQTVLLQPDEVVRIDIVTGVAETRAGIEAMTEKYSNPSLADRVFDLAWSHSQILLQQISASEADAQALRLSSGFDDFRLGAAPR